MENMGFGDFTKVSVLFGGGRHDENLLLRGIWEFECWRHGSIVWRATIKPNKIVNVGLDDILDKYLKGSSYTAAHYMGLMSSSPTVAASDTMASHAGWSEVVDYSEANRQTVTWGSVSGQSINNHSSPCQFTINATVTVGGSFLVTNNTKGGTTGILLNGGAFQEGNRSVVSGDIIIGKITLSASSST